MSKSKVLEVRVRAVVPGGGGCGIFLTDGAKTIVIYVDAAVGAAISMFMQDIPKQRPLTHDLMASILTALGANVQRVVINDFRDKTFFARLIITAENELHCRKIIEIDARPSDSIALAVQQRAPIFVEQHVWEQSEDVSEILEELESSAQSQGEPASGDEFEDSGDEEEDESA